MAPDATKRSVIARPNPWAPPVTTAQRLLRSILFMGKSFHFDPVIAVTTPEIYSLAPRLRGGRAGVRGSRRPASVSGAEISCLAPHPETWLSPNFRPLPAK